MIQALPETTNSFILCLLTSVFAKRIGLFPMVDFTKPSPWYPFIVYELLITAMCYPTQKTYIRKWILAPSMVGIAWYCYTQCSGISDANAAYTIGSMISTQLCAMVYLVYVQGDFPNFWRRVKDGDKPPHTFRLSRKLGWMVDLAWGTRRVGWVQEPKGVLPPRPKFNSRAAFVASRIGYTLLHFLVADLAKTLMVGNPAFDTRVHRSTDGAEAYIRGQPPFWRMANLLLWCFATVSSVSLSFYSTAAIVAGLGFSNPEDWPPIYGSFSEAYTVRAFWR